jgi:hypothetical protein
MLREHQFFKSFDWPGPVLKFDVRCHVSFVPEPNFDLILSIWYGGARVFPFQNLVSYKFPYDMNCQIASGMKICSII